MKKRSKLFFVVIGCLAILGWGFPVIASADPTVGQITVNGRIGEATSESKEKPKCDNDYKITIVADASQIGQGKLPQTGSSNQQFLLSLGYLLLALVMLILIRRKRSFSKRFVP